MFHNIQMVNELQIVVAKKASPTKWVHKISNGYSNYTSWHVEIFNMLKKERGEQNYRKIIILNYYISHVCAKFMKML